MFHFGALVVGALSLPAFAEEWAGSVSVAAPTCHSWTNFPVPGTPFHVRIPSTTLNGGERDCVLGRGNSGEGVRRLQASLILCYGQQIQHDGLYGRKTAEAVANVQRFHHDKGLKVDGTYGPQTRAAMVFAKYKTRDQPDQFDHCWFR